MLAAEVHQGAQVAPQALGAALVVFIGGHGEEMVDGGAAGEDALGAFADDDPDFGVGILRARGDEGGGNLGGNVLGFAHADDDDFPALGEPLT
jgi:hypothetical protein